MPSVLIDEEKGEGGIGTQPTSFSGQSSPTVTTSPYFSRTNTFLSRANTTSDKPKPPTRTSSVWSKRVNSFKSAVGLGTTISNAQQYDDTISSDEDEDVSQSDANGPIVRKIHEQARGYPKLATFLDSDENFMVYRRFGYLQTRLLLDRQDELAKLEFELDMMEHHEAKDPQLARSLLTRRNTTPEKRDLLDKIETKWNAYCQLLSNSSTLAALHKPTHGEHRSVTNWLNNVKPIVPSEARFIRCREDLVILRPGREHAWLDSGIEKMLRLVGWNGLRRIFQSQDTREKSDGRDGTMLFSRGRINHCVMAVMTMFVLALLVVPIYVLFMLSESGGDPRQTSVECIGVLLIATLAFSACISLFTRARRHEILAASAAYCAVLVVFIGNLGQRLPQGKK